VLAPNIPEMLEAHYGVPMAGAVLLTVNIRLDAAAVGFILRHSGARALLVDREWGAVARAALAEVPEDAAVVVVHDAARPLVSDDVIGRVIAALGDGYDGAVPALPVADTLKRVDGDRIVETVDRSSLVAVQTPQAFVAPVLRACVESPRAATDCASLLEESGGRVRIVHGDERLLKVTTRTDLERIAAWL
jgi:2-C-methyl-D-erythritol 4-phosphate cytidylyltransferase